MKKLFKGIFIFIAIVCIAFSAFFVYSYATGNVGTITKIEVGIAKLTGKVAKSTSSSSSTSAASMLTNEFGLSKKQAEQVVNIASELGVDTDNPAEMSALIANNAAHADEIREIAAAVQAGQISESQAKSQLSNILDY